MTVRCELHGDELVEDGAEIVYGLHMPDQEHDRAVRELFPNSWLRVSGGCLYNPNELTAQVHYCPQCRKAEAGWRLFRDTFG